MKYYKTPIYMSNTAYSNVQLLRVLVKQIIISFLRSSNVSSELSKLNSIISIPSLITA